MNIFAQILQALQGKKPTQPSPKKLDTQQWSLNALIKNVIDQTPYTPQAQKQIENNIPIDYYTPPINYTPVNPPMPSNSAGVSYSSPTNPRIIIRSNVLNRSASQAINPLATEVLRHEINHSLDANTTAYNTRYSGDSYGFADILKGLVNKSPAANRTSDFLKRYPNDPYVQDAEGFAQYGTGAGKVYQGDPTAAARYKNIYIPMSKRINYSPIYKIQ